MNEDEMLQEDEISLFDLWEKLREGRRLVVGGALLGIAGAMLAIFLISPKYEAVGVVQVAKVGGQPVEPPVQAVERMKTPAFQRRVAEALGDQKWLDDVSRSASGVTKDLALQIIKATAGPDQIPLIELRANGSSKESAQKKAEATVAELITAHAELAKPALVRMRSDLAISREKLASAERDLESIGKLVAAAGVKDDRFTQLSLMTSLRTQKEAETFSQRQIIMALETALEAPATQPAKSIEAVFVSDKPVSPKKALLLALGSIGGLMLGVMGVFFADAWRRARERRALGEHMA